MSFKKLINKVNKPGIYRTWFLKYLGFLYIFFILIASLSVAYINFDCSKNFKENMKKEGNYFFYNISYLLSKEPTENVDFKDKVKNILYSKNYKNLFEVVALDSNKESIFNSLNLNFPGEITISFLEEMEDKVVYKKLNNGKGNEGFFLLSKKINNKDGTFFYIILLSNAKKLKNKVIFLTFLVLFILLVVLVFLFLVSNHFIKNITLPINEVSKMARCIALGDFKTRIVKKEDNEFGELCDTINYMAQKLFESERMKNDFISSISHELRTPLTAIKGWAETIVVDENLKREDIDMNKKGLEIIANESERLCSIVEELLDFSKLQSGRMILNLEKIDILAELSEAVYILRKKATKENKILLYSEPESIKPILGDKNRLKQVFINIIDNAIKYTGEKGVINIGVKEVGHFVKIEISDNGCGIPKEDLPKVKNKFYKGKFSKDGSGIGLSLANEIVLLHSGNLKIKSEENIGTVVSIHLPININ